MAELSEILQDAIKLEQDGEQYYQMAAEKALNPLAKNTFKALAEQEQEHARLVEAYYDAVREGANRPSAETIGDQDYSLATTAREIFQKARAELAGGTPAAEDLHQLYEEAMAMERKSIALYQAGAEQAADEEQRQFFNYLVEQERGHLKLLADGQQYLEDPESWYFEQEQWSVEG